MRKFQMMTAVCALLCAAAMTGCGTAITPEVSVAETTAVSGTAETTGEAETGTTETTAQTTDDTAETGTTAANASADAAATTATEATTEAPAAETTAAPQVTQAPATEAPAPQATEAPKDGYLLDDLKLGGSCAAYIAAHTNYQFNEADSCLGGDKDRTYTYPDMKLITLVKDGNESIVEIQITGGSFTTRKGIKVGSSMADVKAAYGESSEAMAYVVNTEDGKMKIFFSDSDTVEEIDFIKD
ncbi:MAG: hypothetical protein K5705_12345 [Oscillospiraceae bacterium]|nr:hypothetical protein [Oscillospiraceae bacterium]